MSDEAKDIPEPQSGGLTPEAMIQLGRYAGVSLDAAQGAVIVDLLKENLPLLRRLRPAGYEWLSPGVAVRLPEGD